MVFRALFSMLSFGKKGWVKNWIFPLFSSEDGVKEIIFFDGRGGDYITLFFYIGPGGLRAPCVLACAMRSLAIVITIVQSFSLFFSLFFSSLSGFCF